MNTELPGAAITRSFLKALHPVGVLDCAYKLLIRCRARTCVHGRAFLPRCAQAPGSNKRGADGSGKRGGKVQKKTAR